MARSPSSTECDALVRAEDLSRFSPIDIDPARESESRIDYDDGGVMLRYQYRFDAADRVLVNSYVVVDDNEEEARSTFEHYESGVAEMGLSIERDDRLAWGDESASWVVSTGGANVGHAVLARCGTRTLFAVFSGFFFEGREAFLALIEPKLEALARWAP